jgi:SAM-dependent methyltransferase
VLYIPSDTGFRLPRETILPLGQVQLHGRVMPAPARPEELLAATYGDDWRTPNPAFKYDTPRGLQRRLNGWFGGLISHRKYWDGFYSQQRQRVPNGPSPFAQWVAEHYGSSRPLVDVGCGTARDSLWFADAHGRHVTGLDYNLGVLRRATNRSRRRSLDTEFHLVNLYDTRAVLTWGAILAHREEPCDIYARFTLHALNEPGQENLVRLAAMALRRSGHLFLEFRTPEDSERSHVFTHGRHFVSPQRAREMVEASGGRVVHESTGTGMAPFESEDPVLCRMVAAWGRG